MHFIALTVPQDTTQSLPAVKHTKTADAVNDSSTHIIQKKNPRQEPSMNCFY